ncbi:MAG: polysaccharide biosynthesis protein [Clostridiales bacterium]|nr:polysaccharide biosynthesis protein [Clostridiales bacterium]
MKLLKLLNTRSSGITLSYVYNILNMICGVFLSSFLIKSLGGTEYGIYQTISSFANYLVLLEFGVGTVMTRNISACRGQNSGKEKLDKNISTLWTVSHILALVIILFSVIFYFCIDILYSNSMTVSQISSAKNIFILVSGHLVISFYLQAIKGIALGFEKYSFVSIQNITRILLRTILLIIIIIFFKHSIAIAAIDFFISVILLIFSIFYCKKKLDVTFGKFNFEKTIFKTFLPLCLAIFLQTIVNQANNNVDKFIIGIKMTPEDVTLYSVALYIYMIFSSLSTIPISMYAPQVSMDMSRGIQKKELMKKLISPCRLTAMIGGTVLFGFIAAGKPFINLLYGKENQAAWLIAIILIIPEFFNTINGVLINVLNYLNKRIIRSCALIITTISNIILTIFLIDIWGMFGAAVATCICTIIGQVIIMNIYYMKNLKINIPYMFRHALKGILIYQIIGAAAGFAAGYFIENTILSFLVSGFTFVIVFGIGYMAFGATEKERNKIKKIFFRREK